MPQGPLTGLKVVEIGEYISAPYCSKLLADLGAEVIKVEPLPGGDRVRMKGPFLPETPHPEGSALSIYLNTNKYGVTLDLEKATGREILHRLLAQADFMVDNHLPREVERMGLDYPTLHERHPRLIQVYITPFGLRGPYRDYVASDLVSFHMGGFGYHCPGKLENPEEQPPLRAGGRQSHFVGGLYAAAGALHAWFYRELSGEGALVDQSEQEAVASMLYGPGTGAEQQGKRGQGGPGIEIRPLACKDGYFGFTAMQEHQWNSWVEIIGNPEWAQDERIANPATRMQNLGFANAWIEEWAQQYTKVELHLMGQERRVPVLPVNTTEEAVKSSQLKERGYFVEASHSSGSRVVVPGAPYKFSATPWGLRLPAPRLGEHTEMILRERIGMDKEEEAALKKSGLL